MTASAIIWDMYGVIADTGRYHFQSWQTLANENSASFTEADFKRSFGRRNPEILKDILQRDLSPEEIKKLSIRKEDVSVGSYQAR